MITKEQIINILEDHSFKVYQHGDVVAKSDFDNIADCIVNNLNKPTAIKSICSLCKKEIEVNRKSNIFCDECWKTL